MGIADARRVTATIALIIPAIKTLEIIKIEMEQEAK
jgi:hypothetical protein